MMMMRRLTALSIAASLLLLAAGCKEPKTPTAPVAAPAATPSATPTAGAPAEPTPAAEPPPAVEEPPKPVEKAKPRVAPGAELFGIHPPIELSLTLGENAVASLGRKPRKKVRGELEYGGKTYRKVGVRLKGHRTMQDLDEKPAFILDFDKYKPGRRFLGLKRLVMNNLADDPTMVREVLGYSVLGRAGVPLPRTGYATVTLNGDLLGLYLLVEPVDSLFLARHYPDGTGNLYEGEYGCDLYPPDVDGFDHDSGPEGDREALRALANAATKGLGALVDGDKPLVDKKLVITFLAASAVLADFDGYDHGHNYFLYHEPSRGRFSLMAWGVDRMLYRDYNIFESNGVLARLCFADLPCRLEYVQEVQRVTDLFEKAGLQERMDVLLRIIEPAEKADTRRSHSAEKTAEKRAELVAFIKDRPGQLREQTACWKDGKEVDADGDGHACTDCAPDNPAVHPGAEEVCDKRDNNCSGLPDDSPKCDCPSARVVGGTFHFCDLPMSWADAAAHCKAKGMSLARIDSKAQSKAVQRKTRKVRKSRWWIGLHDRGREGRFEWDDGSPVTFTYWKGSSQPDNDYCGEDCVALARRGKGRWFDTHCETKRPFICRK